MFNSLENKPAEENLVTVQEEMGVSFETALDMVSDLFMEAFLAEDDSAVQEETLENLMALEASVAQFGLTRSLLAFADHNKILSSSIAGIPSLESLTEDLSVEDSSAAIEGIGTTIKSVFKAWWAGVVYSITHPLSSYSMSGQAEERVIMWKHLIDGIKKNMDELHFSKKKAETISNRVVPFDKLIALQKAYVGAPKVLLALWTTELPKKEEEFSPWLAKVKSEFSPIFATEEAKITDKGTLSIPLKRWFVLQMDEKGTMAEKGYDSDEKVKEVISGFYNLLSAVQSLKTVTDTIKERLDASVKEGEVMDHAVVKKAVAVGKNLTRALIVDGIWGVSGASMYTIGGLKKLYTKEPDATE